MLDKLSTGLSKKYIQYYGNNYNVISKNNKELMDIFNTICTKNDIMHTVEECFKYTSEFDEKVMQISLF